MAKYNYQLKKSVVEFYQRGEGGVKQLAEQFGIPAKSTAAKWIKTAKKIGVEGLHRRKKFKLILPNSSKMSYTII